MPSLYSLFGSGDMSVNKKILDPKHQYINEEVEENTHNGCTEEETRLMCSDDDLEFIESDEDREGDKNDSFSYTVKKKVPNKQNSWRIFKELYNREIGLYGDNKKWNDNFYQTEAVVKKLSISKVLKGHRRRVKCIDFNSAGDLIASGSTDCQLGLWNWSKGVCMWRSYTKHIAPIRDAKHLDHAAAICMMSSGEDGFVIRHFVSNCGKSYSRIVLRNVGCNIAVQKDDAFVFLTSLRNGTVHNVDLREPTNNGTILNKFTNARKIPMRIECIDINPEKSYEYIISGNDNCVRMFDKRGTSKGLLKKFQSNDVMSGQQLKSLPHRGNYYHDFTMNTTFYEPIVSSAVYNYNGTEILASYTAGDIYLFDINGPPNKIVHRYSGHNNFQLSEKSVNFYGPRSEYVLSGSDDGYIYIWNKETEAIVLRRRAILDKPVNVVKANPVRPMLATCGWERAIKIWEPIREGHLSDKKEEIQERMIGSSEENYINIRTNYVKDMLF